jgi:hypothetical protein
MIKTQNRHNYYTNTKTAQLVVYIFALFNINIR